MVDPIRVLIVDDQRLFAEMLARVIGMEEDVVVAGTASSLAEGRRLALELEPDVVLMDYQLPDGDGAQGTHELLSDNPDLKIVMLTGFSDERIVMRAIEVGCVGFITKDEAVPQALAAIRAAHKGDVSFSHATIATLAMTHQPRDRPDALTNRESEVIQLLSRGKSIDEISDSLVLSRNTVRNHVQAILVKLGARSQLEAVIIAMRHGLISPPG